MRPRARRARPRRLAAGAAGGAETSNLTHTTSAHVAPQSAPVPPCHVARTCRPLKLTLDLCLQRRPYHVPRLAGPCLAHTALGVAASYAAFLRARLHLLLFDFVVVTPMPFCAVARPRAACCSPPSPPARPCHVPWLAQVSPEPPSASPHSYATCAVALDCASLGVAALLCHMCRCARLRLPRRRRPLMPCAVALDCAFCC